MLIYGDSNSCGKSHQTRFIPLETTALSMQAIVDIREDPLMPRLLLLCQQPGINRRICLGKAAKSNPLREVVLRHKLPAGLGCNATGALEWKSVNTGAD